MPLARDAHYVWYPVVRSVCVRTCYSAFPCSAVWQVSPSTIKWGANQPRTTAVKHRSNMNRLLSSVFCAIVLASLASTAPTAGNSTSVVSNVPSTATSSPTGGSGNATTTSSAPPAFETVPLASDDPNDIEWNVTTTADVQPVRGSLGAVILGPQNLPIDQQNPDLLAPPTSDAGSM